MKYVLYIHQKKLIYSNVASHLFIGTHSDGAAETPTMHHVILVLSRLPSRSSEFRSRNAN